MLTFLPYSQFLRVTGPFSVSQSENTRFCDLTPGNLLLWEDYLSVSCAAEGDRVYLRFNRLDGQVCFLPADGRVLPQDLACLTEAAEMLGVPLCLFPLEEQTAAALAARLPGAVAAPVPGTADYLYDAEALSTFRGHKYNGQRNHVNKFLSLYPDWQCLPAEEVPQEQIAAFLHQYFEQSVAGAPAHEAEHRVSCRLLADPAHGGLAADALVADGRVVAVALGESVGDTLYVHVEKALREVPGAYQMMVQQFSRRHTGGGVRYVNREEDDGNQGLRTAKLALHPLAVPEKWAVTLAHA